MKHVARSPVAKCVYGGFEGRLTYTFVQPPGNPITSLRTRSNLHHLNHHNLAQQPTNPLHSNFYFITFTCSYHHIYRGPVPFSGILSLVGSSSPLQLLLPWVSTSVTPTISPTPPTKPAGNPSPLLSDLRRHRGSRPAALVCTAVERVASKFFYHKYRLVGTAKKVINTAIAVLETIKVVCAHHLQQTDSAPPAESLTWAAILGTRPSGSAKVTLPPHAVSFVVGAFYRLSTIFGGDFHVKLANFLSRVSPPRVFAPEDRIGGCLRVAHRDDETARPLWTRAISYPSSHHVLSAYCLHRCSRLPPCSHFCVPCRWGCSTQLHQWHWQVPRKGIKVRYHMLRLYNGFSDDILQQ